MTTHHEITARAIIEQENASLKAKIAELEAVVGRLEKTADGVPITPAMKIYAPGQQTIATAHYRKHWDSYPIEAVGWGMNISGREAYSSRKAAEAALDTIADTRTKETPWNSE